MEGMLTQVYSQSYNTFVHRRTFLATAIAAASAQPPDFPIIDTHIHLFDTARPEGVPWPDRDNAVLYRPALPDRYRAIAAPLGITGAIEVECSTWLEDNQWVLDIAARSPIMVGTIGNLEPGKPEFAKQLERFHRNPLFRGIRYGNLWGRDFAADVARADFVAGVKLLVAGRARPRYRESQSGADRDRRAPHRPRPRSPRGHRSPAAMHPALRGPRARRATRRTCANSASGRRSTSSSPRSCAASMAKSPRTLAFYRDRLDELYGIFGEDRVLYGSDWPNSDQWAPYGAVLALARAYFETKTRAQAEKYFWKNSVAAYHWVRRDPL